jgi:hypothetical protein
MARWDYAIGLRDRSSGAGLPDFVSQGEGPLVRACYRAVAPVGPVTYSRGGDGAAGLQIVGCFGWCCVCRMHLQFGRRTAHTPAHCRTARIGRRR